MSKRKVQNVYLFINVDNEGTSPTRTSDELVESKSNSQSQNNPNHLSRFTFPFSSSFFITNKHPAPEKTKEKKRTRNLRNPRPLQRRRIVCFSPSLPPSPPEPNHQLLLFSRSYYYYQTALRCILYSLLLPLCLHIYNPHYQNREEQREGWTHRRTTTSTTSTTTFWSLRSISPWSRTAFSDLVSRNHPIFLSSDPLISDPSYICVLSLTQRRIWSFFALRIFSSSNLELRGRRCEKSSSFNPLQAWKASDGLPCWLPTKISELVFVFCV